MSFTVHLPPRTQLYNRSCSNKHTRSCNNICVYAQRTAWLLVQLYNRSCSNKHTRTAVINTHTDPLMVGIRSPDGLVVGSCTSHPRVLGSIPKREEPGKTGAPCVKVPGSSRVPYPPPPHREQLCTRSCSNKTHTHLANSFVIGTAVINTHPGLC